MGTGPGEGRAKDGQGTGRLVHGPGRLWPWPRLPGIGERQRDPRGRETGAPRKAHGRGTDPSRRHEERGRSTLPRVLSNCDPRALDFWPPIGGSKSISRFRGLISGPESEPTCAEVWSSRHLRHRSGRGVASPAQDADVSPTSAGPVPDVSRAPPVPAPPLPRTPDVLGSSWGSQPARTPMRSPGPSSDGHRRPAQPLPLKAAG